MSSKADIVIINGQERVETDYCPPLGLGLNVTAGSRTMAADTLAMSYPLLSMDEIKTIVQSDSFEFGGKWFDSSYITYQNGFGSCAGYAIAGAGTKSRVMQGFDRVDLSGDYQYSRVNDNRDQGSGLKENMDSFMLNGCATSETVKLGDIYRNKYDIKVADAEAARYRGHELFVIADEQSLATALALQMQVIIAIHVDRNWRKFDADDVLYECNGMGNHCEHLDDIRWNPRKGRLEYRKATSHGKDYSGDGYCWTAWDLHYKTTSRYHVFYALASMKIDPLIDIYGILDHQRPRPNPAPTPAPQSELSIVCYTSSNCRWCTDWKKDVAPQAEREGWKIEYRDTGNKEQREGFPGGGVPFFKINVRGNVIDRRGFISFQELKNLDTVR